MNKANAAFAAIPLLAIAGCMGFVLLLGGASTAVAGACGPATAASAVNAKGLPPRPVAGYSGRQLVNAAHIMNAAARLGLDARAQAIGVMTAMGESSLRVLDRGDAAGPDSRGLFQQRANGAWGSYSDRMNPAISAANFFDALTRVPGWRQLAPTIAAHRAQRNADPYHYARFWDAAVDVVKALAKADIAGIEKGTGELPCTGSSPGQISADGWTKPAAGPVTSGFGWRQHPQTRRSSLHAGVDIGAACHAPIYAAADGTVVSAGPVSGYGNLITIAHGGRVSTRYAHMHNNGVLVRPWQKVQAGQQIARVGDAGDSTGCHLHYEVRVAGEFVDPARFMAARGAPVG